ncbi:hypothetical protein Tco_1419031 [Tanacetum coccineum]
MEIWKSNVALPERVWLLFKSKKIAQLLVHWIKTLMSLTDDLYLSLLSKMATLESCPKHNMIAYLEKTKGNVEFHEVIDFFEKLYLSCRLLLASLLSITEEHQFREPDLIDDAEFSRGDNSKSNQMQTLML